MGNNYTFYLITIDFVLNPLLIVTQQASYHDELKMKISEGEKKRKELYNKVLELKGLKICFFVEERILNYAFRIILSFTGLS